MTNAYKQRTACVFDHGLFVEMAVTLAKDFGRVLYACPWESGYPKSNAMLIGEGLPGVTRISSIWEHLDDIDLFVFPDVYQGPLQMHLASLGKRVWGGRMGEELELDRDASKKHLKSLGIPIGPYKVVTGLDALRGHLQEHDDQYVKISRSRGDMETFRSKNYRLIEPRLDELEHSLGAMKKIMQFVVEDAIPDAVEIGYDGYCIDGRFPKQAMWGIEVKDKSFVMQCAPYNALPKQVRSVNEKMAGTLKNFGYRGFISSELRVTKDGIGYAIDPCARAGSPPSELYQIMVKNWSDILWEGAEGVLVEPEFVAKWGAELLLLSSWATKNWQAVEFPPSLRENVKLRQLTVIEGKYYFVPQMSDMPEIGAVVATGNTMEAAIKECKRIAGLVEGHYVEVIDGSLDEASAEFEKLAKFGIQV
jgi:hypothetical protein